MFIELFREGNYMKKLILLFIALILLSFLSACIGNNPTPETLSDEDKIATIVAGTLSVIQSPSPFPTSTFVPALTSTPEPGSDIVWVSFYDSNLKITIQYPENWTLSSQTSGFIRMEASERNNINVPYKIEISQYNIPITPDQTLLNWTEQYVLISGNSGENISVRESLEINGLDAVYTLLDFPEVSYTNYRRGDTVLFVWSNIGKSAGDIYTNIYKQIASSLISD